MLIFIYILLYIVNNIININKYIYLVLYFIIFIFIIYILYEYKVLMENSAYCLHYTYERNHKALFAKILLVLYIFLFRMYSALFLRPSSHIFQI